jgi:hypothetical protein
VSEISHGCSHSSCTLLEQHCHAAVCGAGENSHAPLMWTSSPACKQLHSIRTYYLSLPSLCNHATAALPELLPPAGSSSSAHVHAHSQEGSKAQPACRAVSWSSLS